MARARLLKPGFFNNENLAELGPLAQMLFAGLWTIADKKGRMDDRPKRIKAEVFPYYKADVDVLLSRLEEGGFIERYSACGEAYIQIRNFEKHQHPHKNEPDSVIPSAPANVSAASDIVRTEPDILGSRPAETVAKAKAESETVAEAVSVAPPRVSFVPQSESPFPEPPESEPESFVAVYAKHYAEKNPGRTLSPSSRSDCIRLQNKHGSADCIECAGLYEWDKGPAYLDEVMSDDKWRTRKTGRTAGRGKASGSAEDPSGVGAWEAYAAGEDQRTPAAAAT